MKRMVWICGCLLLGAWPAQAQVRLATNVLGSGGASTSSASVRLVGTLGQPVVGAMGDESWRHHAGFWSEVRRWVGTAVELTAAVGAPERVVLGAAYPNPFAGSTTIRVGLAEPGRVRLAVYDLLGRQVAVLLEGQKSAGRYVVTWDGRDESGRLMAAGVYLYRLETERTVLTRRLVLVH